MSNLAVLLNMKLSFLIVYLSDNVDHYVMQKLDDVIQNNIINYYLLKSIKTIVRFIEKHYNNVQLLTVLEPLLKLQIPGQVMSD